MPARRPRGLRADRRRTGPALGLVALLVGLLAGSAVDRVTVAGTSMLPTLRPGQAVHVLPVPPARVGRGDLVVYRSPHGGAPSVKRVVAVAGQTVELRGGVLVLDGRPVSEPYADHTGMQGVWSGPLVVPPGALYVLGDDRLSSIDSLDHGPVRGDDVRGRVLRP